MLQFVQRADIRPAAWPSRAGEAHTLRMGERPCQWELHFANFFSSIVGAFMYFATLTEIPILGALMGSGMGKGLALALLCLKVRVDFARVNTPVI